MPAFDPAGAPWWNARTKEQRDALVGTTTNAHWSRVSQSPIVLHRAKSGLVLRSVDGCWRQELNGERPARLLVDGPSGVAWEFLKGRVRLFDLLAPGAPLTVAEGLSAGDVAIAGGDGRTLLSWGAMNTSLEDHARPNVVPTLVVHWSAKPRLELRGARDGGGASGGADLALAPAAEAWLADHQARLSPGIRMTRLDLSTTPELASPPAPGSRCTDAALCLGVAPFGASSMELVRYGEIDITQRDDTAVGPLCAVFDPASSKWYEDGTLAVEGADPRQFAEGRTPCEGGWLFDVTGRAYLREGQVCVSSRCSRVEGEPLGFVQGHVLLGG